MIDLISSLKTARAPKRPRVRPSTARDWLPAIYHQRSRVVASSGGADRGLERRTDYRHAVYFLLIASFGGRWLLLAETRMGCHW